MAVRIKLRDGPIDFIEADSAEELHRAYRQFLRNGSRKLPSAEQLSGEGEEGLPENAQKLVRLLLPNPEGMKSEDVAKALGVEPRGLGGFVTSLTNWGRRHNLSKKQLVVKERQRNSRGRLVRGIALTARFRKMIEEGKVKGLNVKLDT